jgi:hypothetical protein
MGFETQRRRGTQRKVMETAQRLRASVPPKSSRFAPKKREPRQITRSINPGAAPRILPNTRGSAENCPYRAKLHGGRRDLAFHARLMELALQAVNTAGLLHATFGFPLLTSAFSLLTSHFSLLTSHFSLLTSHFSLPTALLRFRPVRPAPPARGATPGQLSNEDARPVGAVLSYGPGNASPTPRWRRDGF